jgi:hypothetical protein
LCAGVDFVGHRKNFKPRPTPTRVRFFLATAGIFFIVFGALTLRAGRLHYSNYWGGSVFAPFSVIVGALTIYAAFKSY